MGHPLGFRLCCVNKTLENSSQLSWLMASSKVNSIICGTLCAGRLPGIWVPSFEQKHCGKWHFRGSQAPAAFGSCSTSHQPSSEPSGQSTEPSQKYSCGRQVPSAQPNWYSSAQSAISSSGFGAGVSALTSQLSTFALKSQIWRTTSKSNPSEHLNSNTSPSRQRKYLAHSLFVQILWTGLLGLR